MWILSLAAAGVSGTFTVLLGTGWARRRRPHLLAWTVALALFAAASGAAAAGLLWGWTPAFFRTYYALGAVVNVPVLGLGTVFLLAPRRVASVSAVIVSAACLAALVIVIATPLNGGATRALAGSGIPAGSVVMPDGVRLLARAFSFAGFFVVLGGATWSALRSAREPGTRLRSMVEANALIAIGTSIVALGSGFAVYGQGWPFALGLALGVTVMFVGFLKTRSPPPRAEGST